MKKILSIFILLSFSFNYYSINDVKLIKEENNTISLSLDFDDYQLKSIGLIDGSEHFIISADNTVPSLINEAPNLPSITASIQLFEQGATYINITEALYTDYQNIEIAPSKGNLYRNIDPASLPYIKGSVYNNDAFYPKNIASLREPFVFRSIRGQVVKFTPFQYNPVTKVLRVYHKIDVEVINDIKEIGINELQESRVFNKNIHDINERRFLNYKKEKYTPVGEEGIMLVISKDELVAEMDQFVNWKIKKGIPTEIVPISEIGNTQTSIFNYVSDYYQLHPELNYLLLVGDHADVNSYNAGSTSSEIKWGDAKYGLQAGNDWYPDVFVGRFSASTSQNLQKILDRNMEYEISPLAGDWYNKAIGIGSDEGQGYGDDGEADWQHLRNIRTDLLNFGFSEVFEFYDGSHGGSDASGNPNSNDIKNAVNDGITLFNYTGHGAQNVCVTGNFSSSHINQATNEGKYPFVISVACNNGTFTSGSCMSEAWMLAEGPNSTTGSIAACGSSILMSWAPPMATQDEIVDILVESYATNKKFTLGGLFYNAQMQMNDDYGFQGREVVETWVFFGDPSVKIRTQDPLDLTASHVTELLKGSTSVDINSCNKEGALICLTQNNQIIGTGIVNSDGNTTITFNSLDDLNDITLVGTAYNHRPYQGNIKVVEMDETATSTLTLFPNPVDKDGFITLSFNLNEDADVDLQIINNLGQIVKQITYNGLLAGTKEEIINVSGLSSGIYEIFTVLNKAEVVAKFLVK